MNYMLVVMYRAKVLMINQKLRAWHRFELIRLVLDSVGHVFIDDVWGRHGVFWRD